jgi:hypothetical protein
MLTLPISPQRKRQDKQRQGRAAHTPDDRAPLTSVHASPVSRVHRSAPHGRSNTDTSPAMFCDFLSP